MKEESIRFLIFFTGALAGIVSTSIVWSISIMETYKPAPTCEAECKQLFYGSDETYERLECIKSQCIKE